MPSEFSPGSVGAAEDSADIYDVDYMVENIGEDGEPTSRMTGQTADQKLAAVTDGGEEE